MARRRSTTEVGENLALAVDPVACQAVGLCARLAPELIDLDRWGFPIVTGTPIPRREASAAGRAVKACPRRALALVVED